jgi:hypothetical protein
VKAIHLIQKDSNLLPKPSAPGSHIFESGFWYIDLEKAKKLIGKDIYFHEKQISPSFFGGVIKDCRVEQYEGQARVVFQFEVKVSHRGIRPQNPDGWNRVMNFDEE